MVMVKPAENKPSRYLLYELIKAISGGNDSEARAALGRMKMGDIDYHLQSIHRLYSMMTIELRRKRQGGS